MQSDNVSCNISCSDAGEGAIWQFYFFVSSSVLICTSVIGLNGYLAWITMKGKIFRKNSFVIYLVPINMADLTLGLVAAWRGIAEVTYNRPYMACFIQTLLGFTVVGTSLTMLLVISVVQYLSITHPFLHKQFGAKFAIISSCSVPGFLLIFNTAVFSMLYDSTNDAKVCLDVNIFKSNYDLLGIPNILFLVLVLLGIIIFNGLCIFVLRRKAKLHPIGDHKLKGSDKDVSNAVIVSKNSITNRVLSTHFTAEEVSGSSSQKSIMQSRSPHMVHSQPVPSSSSSCVSPKQAWSDKKEISRTSSKNLRCNNKSLISDEEECDTDYIDKETSEQSRIAIFNIKTDDVSTLNLADIQVKSDPETLTSSTQKLKKSRVHFASGGIRTTHRTQKSRLHHWTPFMTLTVMNMVAIICMLPYIFRLAWYLTYRNVPASLILVSDFAISANSALNPLIFLFRIPAYKAYALKTFRRVGLCR